MWMIVTDELMWLERLTGNFGASIRHDEVPQPTREA